MIKIRKKLLLHICCAPCSTHVVEKLSKDYQVAGYFYNPNMYPEKEYELRLQEAKRLFEEMGVEFICQEKYQHEQWLKCCAGLENEPEGGKRCLKCYRFRLERTAEKAKELNFDIFATTLTISPYKKAVLINPIGAEIAQKYQLEFLSADFKKQGGFQQSLELSAKHNLYRQNYCGCEFSRR